MPAPHPEDAFQGMNRAEYEAELPHRACNQAM
jgi:hypothetical protein